MFKAIIIIFCASLLSFAISEDIDSLFTLCKRGDSKLNECLKNSIQAALPKFAAGIPKFKIPSLDPILVEKVTIPEGTGTVQVVQNYKNYKMYNIIKDSIIKDVDAKIDDKKFTAKIKAFVPKFTTLSDYDFNGRIVLPMVGQGECELTLRDLDLDIFLEIETFEKNGKKFGKVSKMTVTYGPKGAYFHFDNLFNGDKRLGDELNNILNEKWIEIFTDVGKGYQDVTATALSTYIDLICNNVEYDKLFPA